MKVRKRMKKLQSLLLAVIMVFTIMPALTAADPGDEQFDLAPGETYYFDLSSQGVPGALNAALPDTGLKWVPFTYAGTVNAYSLYESSIGDISASDNAVASDRSLFVSNYNISYGGSWDSLHSFGLIFGKDYNTGGVDYTLRSLSVGSKGGYDQMLNLDYGLPRNNEWDQVLDKIESQLEDLDDMSWGQDANSDPTPTYKGHRAFRGYAKIFSSRYWYSFSSANSDADLGFRPVLEIRSPDALGSDGLKTVTFDMDGNGTLGSGSLTSATVVYADKLTLPAITAANGFNYTGNGVGDLGWFDGTTVHEAGTAPILAEGAVLKVQLLPEKYSITVQADGNGIASASAASAPEGVEITLTATPNEGYRFKEWQVVSDGVTIADNKFVMPDHPVTVKAVFEEIPRTANDSGSSGGGGNWSVSSSSCDAKIVSKDGKITLPPCSAGEVSLGEEVTVLIPAEATDKELTVTIEKVLDTQQLLTEGDALASSVYEIVKSLPENFKKPVILIFTFDPSKLKENQVPVVSYYDGTKKKWAEVAGGKVEGNRIAVEVDHFTKFAVFAVDKPGTAPAPNKINFTDIAGHWAEGSIKQAVRMGIVTGYADGTFRPNHPVTRAEFTVMLAGALKLDGTGATLHFKDQDKLGAWAKRAVALAVQAGIVSGYEDGTFRPDAKITRAEMAAMLARALKTPLEANAQTGFADNEDIPNWARGAVEAIRRLGIIGGRGGNQFVPNDTATRSEAVVKLLRMLERNG